MRSVLLSCLVLLTGCGSVELPEQRSYRLDLPPPSGGELPRGGVLRVGEVALAADLGGDRLMLAEGPVAVRAYRHHRWAGPLERLVADAVVTGLERARCFRQVKSANARGGEDWLLTARVLEFHQAAHDGVWAGRATLDLQLVDGAGQLVFQRELSAATPMEGDDPEALVIALSRSVATILDAVVATCDECGVFDRPLDAAPGH